MGIEVGKSEAEQVAETLPWEKIKTALGALQAWVSSANERPTAERVVIGEALARR